MSHPEETEHVEGDGDAAVVAISDPGEVGRAEHLPGDRAIVHVSNVFAWLFPILMVAIIVQVLLRNFGRLAIGPGNQAWLDDAQWWLYGAAVLVGIAYAVTTNSHVRVDIFYDGFDARKKRRTDIFGLAWLFLPFVILCWDVTLPYAIASVASDEGSDSPNGLHNLWILKVFMNTSFLLIAAATWIAYTRYLAQIMRPLWWRKLLYAFPSVCFVVNLVIYYAALGLVLLLTEAATAREATRHPFFDALELGPEEIKWTVLSALIATALLIAAAYVLRDKNEET